MLDCVLSIPQSSVPSSAFASFHWHLVSMTSPVVLKPGLAWGFLPPMSAYKRHRFQALTQGGCNIYCSSTSNYLCHVNKMFTIYSKSDRCISELTLEHLKANRNIHRISNWIWVFYNILHFYHLSRWIMKSPNCILKRVSLR